MCLSSSSEQPVEHEVPCCAAAWDESQQRPMDTLPDFPVKHAVPKDGWPSHPRCSHLANRMWWEWDFGRTWRIWWGSWRVYDSTHYTSYSWVTRQYTALYLIDYFWVGFQQLNLLCNWDYSLVKQKLFLVATLVQFLALHLFLLFLLHLKNQPATFYSLLSLCGLPLTATKYLYDFPKSALATFFVIPCCFLVKHFWPISPVTIIYGGPAKLSLVCSISAPKEHLLKRLHCIFPSAKEPPF